MTKTTSDFQKRIDEMVHQHIEQEVDAEIGTTTQAWVYLVVGLSLMASALLYIFW